MLEITINKKAAETLKKGFPWALENQLLRKNSSLKIADPGEICMILDEKGRKLAIGYFNPNTQISARVLTLKTNQKIDKEFFREKFERALQKRKKLSISNGNHKSSTQYYFRLVFGESDYLPGLIIDLYGKYAVAQVNSAGMEKLQNHWLPALVELFDLDGIFMDGTSKHRIREGIEIKSEIIFGKIPTVIEIHENNLTYFANLFDGQKTGWFYDQRKNRNMLAIIAGGKTVLDLYTHSGGFGLLCAANHAKEVVMVDRSDLALSLADQSSQKNNLKNCYFIKSEVFDYLDVIKTHNKNYDIVNADPPAFIKSRHDIAVGLKGYEKLTKRCINLVKEDGIFAISSCSFFARPDIFKKTIENAIASSGRSFELVFKFGADKDHPIHPMLAETNYLKFLAYKMDT